MKSFITRLISGVVLLALAIFLIVTGGNILILSTVFISIVGLFEFYRVFGLQKSLPAILGYIVTLLYYAKIHISELESIKPSFVIDTGMLFMVFFLLLLGVFVIRYPSYNINEIAVSFFGVIYVCVMLSYIYLTRMEIQNGKYIVWLIFLCSWGCDTCAYCVGVLFGKHKMSPVLSPKKSVEGAFGGVIGAMLLTFIYTSIFKANMDLDMKGVIILSLISGVGALFSMVGDLAASAVKRNYGVKDYGKLIPGHGGILDRFDSMIITAPIVFYLSHLVQELEIL
ncbi:MAG: phosphatidate cytidylyltransferase [Lachnospiraceae bacterium]|nr:phosphatidate cytidylyltransferase [Lachnospiraceae bacterium]